MKPLKKLLPILTALALTLILPINAWAADSAVTDIVDEEITEDEIIEAPAGTDIPTAVPDTEYGECEEGEDEPGFSVPDYVYKKPEIHIEIPEPITVTAEIITSEIPDDVQSVPYSCFIKIDEKINMMKNTNVKRFVVTRGALPEGITLNSETGELYGITTARPGEYKFTVGLKYNGTFCDLQDYTFVVKDNTDENVDAVNTGARGYALNERVSKNITVHYIPADENNYFVTKVDMDSDLFWSEGALGEFVNFYIDGKKLEKNVDYTAEEGSTKITVRDQTFGNTGVTADGIPHTLAAEFRTESGEMKVSAQNVYITYSEEKTDNKSSEINEDNAETGSVTATMNIVDENGKPVSGLHLVLHSEPKEAVTDSSGNVKFGSVGFGKHKLYALSPDGKEITSLSFSIISGSGTELKDNVISAKDGTSINLLLEYDGSQLRPLSVQEDVSAGAGVYGGEAAIGVMGSSKKYGAGIAVGAAVAAVIAAKRKLKVNG